MFKYILGAALVGIVVMQILNLMDINLPEDVRNTGIHIAKTPLSDEYNESIEPYFLPENWLLTNADITSMTKEKEEKNLLGDSNATLKIITREGSRKLCKGKRCITILGIVTDKLIVQKDDNTTQLKKGESVFGKIVFEGTKGVHLFFEDNSTGEKYKLRFFAYAPQQENNSSKKQKRGKGER